jgi:hypothetical protein
LLIGLVIPTLLGTLLVASGAGALNQLFERPFDAQMKRTARRPLASGRVKPSDVLWFGVSLSLVGAMYLALAVNALSALLAVATLLCYLFVYTPLKRKTALCTFIGAFPGAVPPLIGWAAACRRGGEFLRNLPERRCFAGSNSRQSDSCDGAPHRLRLSDRWRRAELDLLLLQRELCSSQIKSRGKEVARRVDHLSSGRLDSYDAGQYIGSLEFDAGANMTWKKLSSRP